MSRPIIRTLLLLAMSLLLICNSVASPLPGFTPDDQKKTDKNSTANPKKPAPGKNSGEADKIKTDDRMSTRGLKPPPKDADKDKSAKPDSKSSSGSDSNSPK